MRYCTTLAMPLHVVYLTMHSHRYYTVKIAISGHGRREITSGLDFYLYLVLMPGLVYPSWQVNEIWHQFFWKGLWYVCSFPAYWGLDVKCLDSCCYIKSLKLTFCSNEWPKVILTSVMKLMTRPRPVQTVEPCLIDWDHALQSRPDVISCHGRLSQFLQYLKFSEVKLHLWGRTPDPLKFMYIQLPIV
jgi:hypothetical protein